MKCKQCGIITSDTKEYRPYHCRKCYNANNKQRARIARKKNPENYLYYTALRRTIKLDRFKCSITPDDIIIPTHCPILGSPLGFDLGWDNSPSIDRIDSSKGYTPENIWVISRKANCLKGNRPLSALVDKLGIVGFQIAK